MAVLKDHYARVETCGDEWAEQQMQNWEKYSPIEVWNDSLKYVFLTLLGRIPCFKPRMTDVEQVRAIMRRYAEITVSLREKPDAKQCAKIKNQYYDGIELMWPKLQEILLRNKGLLELMLHGGGAESLSFAIFPVKLVPRAIALESAWGNNYDNRGIYRKLDDDDISARYAAVEPIFVELRRRTAYAQKVINEQLRLYGRFTKSSDQKTIRVVSLGAGLLVEFRKFGMTLDKIKALSIVACDADRSLKDDLDTVFQFDFGVPLAETGIDYRFSAIRSVLNDETLWGTVDVVLMDGVLSYCGKDEQLEYLTGMKRLLKPTGKIVCDLQVMDPSLIRCAFVQEWRSSMSPEGSANKAIRKMDRHCKVVDLEMKASVDPRNPRPLGVIFELSLPKKKST